MRHFGAIRSCEWIAHISCLGAFLSLFFFISCQKNNNKDTYELVYEMRIASFMYHYETMTMVNQYNLYQVRTRSTNSWGNKWLLGTMVQDGRFEYEEGYEYVFKVTTVWENHPDINKADGGPITQPKYELLSKTKVNTDVRDEDIWKEVPSETYYW